MSTEDVWSTQRRLIRQVSPRRRWESEIELELKEKTTLSRENPARRLHAIADELASGNDIIMERDQARFVAKVPADLAMKIEFEVETARPNSR